MHRQWPRAHGKQCRFFFEQNLRNTTIFPTLFLGTASLAQTSGQIGVFTPLLSRMTVTPEITDLSLFFNIPYGVNVTWSLPLHRTKVNMYFVVELFSPIKLAAYGIQMCNTTLLWCQISNMGASSPVIIQVTPYSSKLAGKVLESHWFHPGYDSKLWMHGEAGSLSSVSVQAMCVCACMCVLHAVGIEKNAWVHGELKSVAFLWLLWVYNTK